MKREVYNFPLFRRGQRKEVLIVFLLISLISEISALGISPPGKEYNFKPELSDTLQYDVIGADERGVNVSVQGDLAQYVSLNTAELKESGVFYASFKLPAEIKEPGKHRILLRVQENPEEGSAFIVVSIAVIAFIDIYVPYPGQYIEMDLLAHDTNVGDPVNFVLKVSSKGDSEVNMTPKIDIVAQDGRLDTLYLDNRIIKSQENLELKKTFDTTGYNPGKYHAVATIDYGALAKDEEDFRIGSLDINILNYTNEVPIRKIARFDVIIESGWNDKIDGVFAQIDFLNGSNLLQSFKTSSESLTPWERKTLTGYFDTSNFTEGTYSANVTLTYFGKEVGKTKSQILKVKFVKGESLFLWYLVGGLGTGIILLLVLIKVLLKLKHGKKKKK